MGSQIVFGIFPLLGLKCHFYVKISVNKTTFLAISQNVKTCHDLAMLEILFYHKANKNTLV